jgi:hypothetical protein
MKLIKRDSEACTNTLVKDLPVVLLSDILLLRNEDHYVNWKASVLDGLEGDFELTASNDARDPEIVYYHGKFNGRDYHVSIDDMDDDEIFVRAVVGDEIDGYFDFEKAV